MFRFSFLRLGRGILLMGFVGFVFLKPFPSQGEGVLEGREITISGGVDFYDKYVWRGFTLDDDPVLQPGITVSGYGLSLSFWSSWGMVGSASDEADYILEYSRQIGEVILSLGHTFYDFPGADSSSKEYYLGISFPEVFLTPQFTFYRDYKAGKGEYYSLALSHSFSLSDDVNLNIDFSTGYNRGLFIEGKGEDYQLLLSLDISLKEGVTLSPRVGYAVPSGDLKDPDDGDQVERFFTGVGISFEM